MPDTQKRKKRLVLDWDGVVKDLEPQKLDIAYRLFGDKLPAGLQPGAPLEKFLTKAEYAKVRQVASGKECSLEARFIPGAAEYIQRIQADGIYAIDVVTERDGEFLDAAEKSARQDGLSLSFTGVGYGNSKIEALRGADVFMDNTLQHLINAIGIVPNLFLLDRENDQRLIIPPEITRVECWCAFYDWTIGRTRPYTKAAAC